MLNRKLRLYVYAGGLFMTTYSSLPAYINSSFLSQFLPEQSVGWLYAGTSIISIILMLLAPIWIKRYGSRSMLLGLSLLGLLFLGLLAWFGAPADFTETGWQLIFVWPLLFFSLYFVLGDLARYSMDVYLEHITDNKHTGTIRGIFLTLINLTWISSPLLATYLVGLGNYRLVYAVAGLLFAPLILIAWFGLQNVADTTEAAPSALREGLKKLISSHTLKFAALRRILTLDFLLNFFYATMVVYTPLYLHNHIGLAWSEIGLAFTIMLLPFVLFELPLGRIADRWLGEKEILAGGFVVLAAATAAITFLDTKQWLLWAALLFLTRTGAAAIEIMKETYLFKKIDGEDAEIISLSRINVPFSYLIATAAVSTFLIFFDLRYLFLALGLFLTTSIIPLWSLKDTK